MIQFSHEKEKEILLHYAKLLNNEDIVSLVKDGFIKDKDQVKSVARFYWEMVDRSVEEDELGTGTYENMEKWLERIYTSLHIYFNNTGLEEAWDAEIP